MSDYSKLMLKQAVIGVGTCLAVVSIMYCAAKLSNYADSQIDKPTYSFTNDDTRTSDSQTSGLVKLLKD